MLRLSLLAASCVLCLHSAEAFTISLPTAIDETLLNGLGGTTGAFAVDGLAFAGDGIVATGVGPGHAIPDDITGMVVELGQETVTFPHPQTNLLVAWYTADTYNSITVNGTTITGADLSALGFSINPIAAAANLYLDISGLGTFNEATFASTAGSFEFNVNSDGAATPETSTWLMMFLGFAALAYSGVRRHAGVRAGVR